MNYKKPLFWIIIVAVIACIVAAICFLTPEKETDKNVFTGTEYAVDEALENAVSSAIIKNSDGKYKKGTFAAENHEILRAELIEENGKQTVKVYLIAAYTEYLAFGKEALPYRGGQNPTVITFACENGNYILKDYWEATRAAGYAASIRESFHSDIAEKIIRKEIDPELWVENEKKAAEFYSSADEKYFASSDIDGVSVSVMDFATDAEEAYIEYEIINSGKADISIAVDDAVKLYKDDNWYDVKKILSTLPDDDRLKEVKVKTGETVTMKFMFKNYDITESGCYRIEKAITSDGVKGAAYIDFTFDA